MGKFFEALKKSEALAGRSNQEVKVPQEVVGLPSQRIDELKLDTRMPEEKKLPPPTRTMIDGMDDRLRQFFEPGSVAAECFKLLRAKILTKKNSSQRPRSIMVTSPQPMDGKTTVAANLAVNIALGINEYVVLVDCDLRRPSLAQALGIHAEKGLREYLDGGNTVADYLLKTSINKLTLLPAGEPPINPSELLSSDKMRELVEELRSRYDDRYIIYDATPAQFGAETTFLASMLDSVILVVRPGKTDKDLAIEAVDNIGKDKILGIVLNAAKEAENDYKYYYKHYPRTR